MKILTTLVLMALTLPIQAQEQPQQQVTTTQEQTKKNIELPQWMKDIKFSGYGILQYQSEDKEGDSHNEFNLRQLRLILDGKIGDFAWRAQIQATSNAGPGNPTVMLNDLYGEWVKYKELRVRAGQFKRPFTFDNPTHPITQGWYSYAIAVNALAGLGDRSGEKASGGRDIGIQLQGDLFPNSNGRRLLHYQIGVFNGEGINQKDKDSKKDLIGGLWVMPIEGLRIGASGWTGTRADMIVGTYTDPTTGKVVNKLASLCKNRYALSIEYDKDEYLLRAEYIHSQGWGSGKPNDNTVNYALGDKADGWYASAIVPVIKSKLHAKARYQAYRDNKQWNRMKTMYEVGFNYFFYKNLQLNFEYARMNDRTAKKHNYNFFDVELAFRF